MRGSPRPGVVYVGFDGAQIEVRTPALELVAGIRWRFQAMMETSPGNVVASLEAFRARDRYMLYIDGENSGEDESPEEALVRMEDAIAAALIAALPKRLWFHAGAAASAGGAVLLSGEWGSGKSTLVTSLCRLGWRYVSDEFACIDPVRGVVLPFPMTPTVRRYPGVTIPRQKRAELKKDEIILGRESVSRSPVPIMAVGYPVFDSEGGTTLELCRPGEAALELLRGCLNHKRDMDAAFRFTGDLMARVPAFRLRYRDGAEAARLLGATMQDPTLASTSH